MSSIALIAIVCIAFVAALSMYLVFTSFQSQPSGPNGNPPNTRNSSAATTTTSTLAKNFYPVPNPAWQDISGYASAFDQCKALCFAYRNNACDPGFAVDYCNSTFSVDINKNGQLSQNDFGNPPIGAKTCETNVRCFNVIESCPCGQEPTLNVGGCVDVIYNSLSSQGVPADQVYSSAISQLNGACSQNQPPV